MKKSSGNIVTRYTTGVSAVAAGNSHSLFLKTDTTLRAMGGNGSGQLGDGTTISRSAPVASAPPLFQWSKDGVPIAGVTSSTLTLSTPLLADAGSYTVVATNSSGSVTSDAAILLVNVATPVVTWAAPAAFTYGTALSAAQLNATANVAGTFVYTPAAGTVLGPGKQALSVTFTPNDTTNYIPVTATTTLEVYFLPAITTQPQSQIGSAGQSFTFSVRASVPSANAVAAGFMNSLFVKADGTLWAMGSNYFGQLGDGTTTTLSTPVQVATGVSAVATGLWHSLYVKTDGTLWAMGNNGAGQLGDGTTTNRSTPVQVATGVSAVAAGGGMVVVLTVCI